MSGSLLCDYVLGQKQAKGQIPADGQVIKSIVTTNLVNAVLSITAVSWWRCSQALSISASRS